MLAVLGNDQLLTVWYGLYKKLRSVLFQESWLLEKFVINVPTVKTSGG